MPPPPQDDLTARLAAAMQAHQAGRPGEALRGYAGVLADPAAAAWPGRADALHLSGLARAQQGDPAAAVGLLRQALAVQPAFPAAWANLAELLEGLGRAPEAIAAWREAVAHRPGDPAMLRRLGDLLRANGQAAEAVPVYRQVLGKAPADAEAWLNLGLALLASGRAEGAITAMLRARELAPTLAGALAGLGAALAARGNWVAAVPALQGALAERPSDTASGVLLGRALLALGRVPAAIVTLRGMLALRPGLPSAQAVLGRALLRQGRAAAALAGLRPVLRALGRPAEAATRYAEAAALDPALTEARHGAALARLTLGDYAGGWPEFVWRLHDDPAPPLESRLRQPVWSGEADLAGKRILLHAERTLEDSVQFVRYVPMVAALGAEVILRVQPPLHALLAAAPELAGNPAITLLLPGAALPPFDLRCALADLPRAFATTLPTVPARLPYLAPPPVLLARWREVLPPDAAGSRRIGIAWSNSLPESEAGMPPTRMPAAALGRLLDALAVLPVRLHALGPPIGPFGTDAVEAAVLDRFPALLDLRAAAADAANLAAALCCLDLVIAVDGPVLHLAGALGRPVWAMLPAAADWRWLAVRRDSPWYPTARLFRQRRQPDGRDDWAGVVAAALEAL